LKNIFFIFLIFITSACSAKLRFKNSAEYDLKSNHALMGITWDIIFDGQTFHLSDLGINEATEYKKIDSGNTHTLEVSYSQSNFTIGTEFFETAKWYQNLINFDFRANYKYTYEVRNPSDQIIRDGMYIVAPAGNIISEEVSPLAP